MICETEGTETNTTIGKLEPAEYVENYQGGEITEILKKGTDDEDIEEFRKKVIETFKTTAFCGNKADYRRYINQLKGIGGCKPRRRQAGEAQIDIYIISDDFSVPDAETVKNVQEAVDPEDSHGEGNGMAPICHTVHISGVTKTSVTIQTKVTYDSGYSTATSKTQIETAVKTYLRELCESWEAKEETDMIVRLSQIEARILNVEGVADVEATTINGKAGNLALSFEKIPVLEAVNIV